jgi:hypothetical protein
MVVKIKNHLDEKVEKESNHWKYNHKQNGKPLIIEEAESSSKNKFINCKSSSLKDIDEIMIPNNLEINGLPNKINPEYILGIMK